MKIYKSDNIDNILVTMLEECKSKIESNSCISSATTGINASNVVNLGRGYIELTDIRNNIVLNKRRKNNKLALLIEALWVLTGDSHLPKILTDLVPRMSTFSDYGTQEWRGAYGPRLMTEGSLEHALLQLRMDKNTRKAVSLIGDIRRDSITGYMDDIGTVFTKDNVCNLALLFEVEDGKLNSTVLNRSNDILFGLTNVNVVEFTVIQMIMAEMINVDYGNYCVFTNNHHLYLNSVSQSNIQDIIDHYEAPIGPCMFSSGFRDIVSWRSVNLEARHIMSAISNLFDYADTTAEKCLNDLTLKYKVGSFVSVLLMMCSDKYKAQKLDK